MRKREIHSVAHWAMMFLLLMFPILMVGLSSLGNSTYQSDYQVTPYSVNSDGSFLQEHEYLIDYSNSNAAEYSPEFCFDELNFDPLDYGFTSGYNYDLFFTRGDGYLYLRDTNLNHQEYKRIWGSDITEVILHSTSVLRTDRIGSLQGSMKIYLLLLSSQTNDYRTDVNKWIDGFINLPINSWYQSLMTVIGVGFTDSTVMNVIYVMPVYILWVFIFDVIVDCFLVIIKLPHKLLNRLSGGENE